MDIGFLDIVFFTLKDEELAGCAFQFRPRLTKGVGRQDVDLHKLGDTLQLFAHPR